MFQDKRTFQSVWAAASRQNEQKWWKTMEFFFFFYFSAHLPTSKCPHLDGNGALKPRPDLSEPRQAPTSGRFTHYGARVLFLLVHAALHQIHCTFIRPLSATDDFLRFFVISANKVEVSKNSPSSLTWLKLFILLSLRILSRYLSTRLSWVYSHYAVISRKINEKKWDMFRRGRELDPLSISSNYWFNPVARWNGGKSHDIS